MLRDLFEEDISDFLTSHDNMEAFFRSLKIFVVSTDLVVLTSLNRTYQLENLNDFSLSSIGSFANEATLLVYRINENFIIQVTRERLYFLLSKRPYQMISSFSLRTAFSSPKGMKAVIAKSIQEVLLVLSTGNTLAILRNTTRTEVDVVQTLQNVLCFDTFAMNRNRRKQHFLAVVCYGASRETFLLVVLQMKKLLRTNAMEEDSDGGVLSKTDILCTTELSPDEGNWTLKNQREELADLAAEILFTKRPARQASKRPTLFSLPKYVAEVGFHVLSQPSESFAALGSLTMLLRTNQHQLFVYTVNVLSSTNKSTNDPLAIVGFSRVLVPKVTLCAAQHEASDLFETCQTQFLKVNRFGSTPGYEVSGVLVHNRVSKEAFAVMGDAGYVNLVSLGHSDYNALAVSTALSSSATETVLFITSLGRLFLSRSFSLQAPCFRTRGLPITKLPLRATVSKMQNVAGPVFLCLCTRDETEEEVDLAVRTSDTLQLVNVHSALASSEREAEILCDQFSCMRHERGLCLEQLSLAVREKIPTDQQMTGFSSARATGDYSIVPTTVFGLGTGFVSPFAEDVPCKGRILLFTVVAVKDENQADPAKGSYKLGRKWILESHQMRGPVSAMSSVGHKLVAALGNCPSQIRIFKYDTRADSFLPLTFYDSPFFTVSIDSLPGKGYLLVNDIYNSVQVIDWNHQKVGFDLVCKSYNVNQNAMKERLLNGRFMFTPAGTRSRKARLAVVCTDHDGNLRVMMYNLMQSRERLINVADINVRDKVFDLKLESFGSVPGSLLLAGKSGALMRLSCIDEEQRYRKLFTLQAALAALEPKNNAGLNPRSFRNTTATGKKQKSILDGLLLKKFVTLPKTEQETISKMIGYSVQNLLLELK